MNTPEEMVNVYLDIVTSYPQVWVIELIAAGVLLWFAFRHRLVGGSRLKRFILTGRVETIQPDTTTSPSIKNTASSFTLGPSGSPES
jgi:hypothetical protein